MNEVWKCCIQEEPKTDGEYFVFISNLQIGDEIRVVSYRNKKWQCMLEEEEMIIAWKKVTKRRIHNRRLWIEEHKKIIQKEFQLDEINFKDFEIVETLEECVCIYSNWFHYKQIRYIDGIYIVKVFF